MKGPIPLLDRSSYDMCVSLEAKQLSQPTRNLLAVGWDRGVPTSMTETESSSPWSPQSERFRYLARTVREECAHLSSVREIVTHPAYLQIIGMGPAALPLIFKELEDAPGHWFPALRAIAQEDPVLPGHRGVIDEMSRDWLDWARRRGLRW